MFRLIYLAFLLLVPIVVNSQSSILSPTQGGTGLNTYTTGDIIYANGTNTLAKLPVSTNGFFLTLSGGVPAWVANPNTDNQTLSLDSLVASNIEFYTLAISGGNSVKISVPQNDGNGIYGGSGTVPASATATLTNLLTFTGDVSNTNTAATRLAIQTNSTGTVANGFGGGIVFQGESSTTTNRDMARITSAWTNSVDANREAKLSIELGDNGGALSEIAYFNRISSSSGTFGINGSVLVGATNSASISNSSFAPGTTYTFGGNTNPVSLTGTSTSSTTSVLLSATGNNTNASGTIGNSTFTTTSGNKYAWRVSDGFIPTSGTGTFANLFFNGTFNQTGGANGVVRNILLTPTLTSIADYKGITFNPSYTASNGSGATTALEISPTFNLTGTANGIQRGVHINPTLTSIVSQFRAIDISVNNANAYGIYQSGANTINQLIGTTYIGGSTTPSGLRFLEGSGSGVNYTGFVAPTTLGSDQMYTLPSDTPNDGEVLTWNTGGTLSWTAASGADGNGIYSGSGTVGGIDIKAATQETGSLSFTYNPNTVSAVAITDNTGVALSAPDNATQIILTNNDIDLFTNSNARIKMTSSTIDLQNLGGNINIGGAASPSEMRFLEGSGGGTNYIAIVAPSTLGANQTWILPTDAPANGEVLTWNTGNQLSWEAAGGTPVNIYNTDGNVKDGGTFINVDGDDGLIFTLDNDAGQTNTFFRMTADYTADDAFTHFFELVTPIDSLYITSYDSGIQFDYSGPTGSGTALTFNSNTVIRLAADSIAVPSAPTKSVLRTLWGGWGTENYMSTIEGTATGQILIWDETAGYWELGTSSGDGNGIYSNGANTIGLSVVATLQDDDVFQLNWFDDSNAIFIDDAEEELIISALDGSKLYITNNEVSFSNSSGSSCVLDGSLFSITANSGISSFSDSAFGDNVSDVFILTLNSSDPITDGFGTGFLFRGESNTTVNMEMARIASIWTNSVHDNREAKLSFQLGDNGGGLEEVVSFDTKDDPQGSVIIGSVDSVRIDNDEFVITQNYVIGNSTSSLTLGNSSGTVAISSTAASNSAILLNPANSSNISNRVTIGSESATNTSGEKVTMDIVQGFAPTSGTGTFNSLKISNTINQTGGANGISRSIYINPTLTQVANFKGVEIDYAGADVTGAWGIYQVDNDVLNYFNGHLLLGTTTDQSGYNLSSAGPIRTEDGHVLIRGNGAPASDIGAAAIRMINTTGSEVFNLGVEDDDEVYFGTGNSGQVAKITSDGIFEFDYGIRNRQQSYSPTFSTNNYTLILSDEGKMLLLSNGATAGTLTVPPNSSVAFPIGTVIDMTQTGSGQITVTPGSGVTINSADSKTKFRVQYSGASLIKTDTNTWILVGDISI